MFMLHENLQIEARGGRDGGGRGGGGRNADSKLLFN